MKHTCSRYVQNTSKGMQSGLVILATLGTLEMRVEMRISSTIYEEKVIANDFLH